MLYFADLVKVGREIKLGREMVQLDSPYTYFLFLVDIAYISPFMGKVIKYIMAVCPLYHTPAYFIYKAE